MSEGAVTMLALAILLYLYFKWRVTRCCNSREAELTQVITKPSAPTLDLEMALRMNQSLAMQLLQAATATDRNPTGAAADFKVLLLLLLLLLSM